MSDDLFRPHRLAHIVRLPSSKGRALFDNLAAHYHYIVQIYESGPARWNVLVWHGEGQRSLETLGIKGELGALGWTLSDHSLAEACQLATDAIEALEAAEANYIVIFHPGDWWHDQVRRLRRSSVSQHGGAS